MFSAVIHLYRLYNIIVTHEERQLSQVLCCCLFLLLGNLRHLLQQLFVPCILSSLCLMHVLRYSLCLFFDNAINVINIVLVSNCFLFLQIEHRWWSIDTRNHVLKAVVCGLVLHRGEVCCRASFISYHSLVSTLIWIGKRICLKSAVLVDLLVHVVIHHCHG